MMSNSFSHDVSRRQFIEKSISAVAAVAATTLSSANTQPLLAQDKTPSVPQPTRFQHACMTLPYSDFPLERALTGIKGAGYRYVAWGVKHRESNGEQVPVLAEDASTET